MLSSEESHVGLIFCLIRSLALTRSCSTAEPLVCSSPKDYLDLWFRHKAGRQSEL